MKLSNLVLVIFATFVLFNCQKKNMNNFSLTSAAFGNEEYIPVDNSCEGLDESPLLKWDNAPNKTKYFALTCIDPDASMGDWIHWIAWNIPGAWETMPLNINYEDQSQFTQGTNSWGRTGYGGPCPPIGHGPHRYFFTLYALDKEIDLDSSAPIEDLLPAIENNIIAKAVLMGKYERK